VFSGFNWSIIGSARTSCQPASRLCTDFAEHLVLDAGTCHEGGLQSSSVSVLRTMPNVTGLLRIGQIRMDIDNPGLFCASVDPVKASEI
jgi:hypothetical protein